MPLLVNRARKRWFRNGVVLLAAATLLLIGNCLERATASNSVSAFVQNTIYSNKITIFCKSYCPYCPRAKRMFSELHQQPLLLSLIFEISKQQF